MARETQKAKIARLETEVAALKTAGKALTYNHAKLQKKCDGRGEGLRKLFNEITNNDQDKTWSIDFETVERKIEHVTRMRRHALGLENDNRRLDSIIDILKKGHAEEIAALKVYVFDTYMRPGKKEETDGQ